MGKASIAVSIPSMIAIFFITGALAVMILVSVSVPFIKSIAFVDATNGANELSVGNFGACFANGCGPHELNYPVLNYIQTNLGLASATLSGTVQNLTYALVLNPIFAGFCFVAWLSVVLPAFGMKTGGIHTFASIWLLVTWLFGLAAVGITVGYSVRVRNAIQAAGGNANLGKGFWLVIAAAGAITIAQFFTWCSAIVARRKRSRDRKSRDYFEDREPIGVHDSATDPHGIPARTMSQRSYAGTYPVAPPVTDRNSMYVEKPVQTDDVPAGNQLQHQNSELLAAPGNLHSPEPNAPGGAGGVFHHGGPPHVVERTTYPANFDSASNRPGSYNAPSHYSNVYNNNTNANSQSHLNQGSYNQQGSNLNPHASYHEAPAFDSSNYAPIEYRRTEGGGVEYGNEKYNA